MVTNEEAVIRDIFGPSTNNLRPFICAIEVMEDLLFVKKIPLDDIHVTLDIYPRVAEKLQKKNKATTRQIQRLSNVCWDLMDAEQRVRYIGKSLNDIHGPKDILVYLAFYSHSQCTFYESYR